MTITIGNDVEFILVRNNAPKSSVGLIGGSKSYPLPCLLGALQEDNVLAEINIDPASTLEEWETNNTTVIRELQNRLPPDVLLSTLASAFYSAAELDSPQAKEFGCDPDMNAWKHKFNKFKALSGKFKLLRSAGGHVHVGIPDLDLSSKFELIRCMDAFIGLQTVLIDKDVERKKLYGKAGAMRIKPYGVEWRVPSNFWIHTQYDRRWMFESALFCASNFKELSEHYKDMDIVRVINENSHDTALEYIAELRKKVDFQVHSTVGV